MTAKRYGKTGSLAHESVGKGYRQIVLPKEIIDELDLLKPDFRGAIQDNRKLSYREVIQTLVQHYYGSKPLLEQLGRAQLDPSKFEGRIITDIDGNKFLEFSLRYRMPWTDEVGLAMQSRYHFETKHRRGS